MQALQVTMRLGFFESPVPAFELKSCIFSALAGGIKITSLQSFLNLSHQEDPKNRVNRVKAWRGSRY